MSAKPKIGKTTETQSAINPQPIHRGSINDLREMLWDRLIRLNDDAQEVDLKRSKEVRAVADSYLSSIRLEIAYLRATGLNRPIALLE